MNASFGSALPLTCAFALIGLISCAEASEREAATSVALAFPAVPSARDATLPQNLNVPSTLVPLMREMLMLSPTFRRQCARIARASEGRVEIRLRGRRSIQVNAASLITRREAGKWTAIVEVFFGKDLPEMLGHELEHVIEHLDGINLPRLAQQGLDGVRAGPGEFDETRYETARAVAAGKRVAAEFAAGRDQRAGRNVRFAS